MTEPSNNQGQQISTVRKMTAGNGLAARLQNAPQVTVDVSKLPNRIALIFDDSGSMYGSAFESAKTGVEAWIKCLNPNDTAVEIIPLEGKEQALTNNMAMLNMYVQGLQIVAGTPIFKRLKFVLDKLMSNRIILFSDGAPTDRLGGSYEEDNYVQHDKLPEYCTKLIEAKIPVDTCFIGEKRDVSAIEFMQKLAEGTGGIFMHFTGPETFKTGLKYLSPGKRHLLANAEIKEKIQRGEVI